MAIGLRCLGCGHRLELAEAYESYEGDVRCWKCGAVLEVVLQEGRLRSMRPSPGNGEETAARRAERGEA
jgi:DNA-directed RNA polymerase subunit N (RpoN/RPB10)